MQIKLYVETTVSHQNPAGTPDDWVVLEKVFEKTKINARDSVWICGRLLKIYDCFECLNNEKGISDCPIFSPDEWMINEEEHGLMRCVFTNGVAGATISETIKAIAEFTTSLIVMDSNPYARKYLMLLKSFAKTGRASFEAARDELYRLTKELWGTFCYTVSYPDNEGNLVYRLVKDE